MQTWRSIFLGASELPRELSAFELEAFFTFSADERQLIEQRRAPSLKLGLALQIGFLRMSGHPLDAFRIVPANLWRQLGAQFSVVTLISHHFARYTGQGIHFSNTSN